MKISYKKGNSLFHKIDPLSKFLWSLLISIWLLSIIDLKTVLIISLIIAITSIIMAKIELKILIRALKIILIGGFGITLFQGIFRHGPGISLGLLNISLEGIKIGLALTVRMIGIAASCLAFSTTTKPKDFSNLLVKLGLNYKIAHIFYLSLRFLPVFEEDAKNIIYSQKLRGIKSGTQKITRTIVTFLLTELRHTDETAIALEMRGFGLQNKKTILDDIKISKFGILIVIITLLSMVTHLILNFARL